MLKKAFQVGDNHWKYIFLLLSEKSSAPRQVEHLSLSIVMSMGALCDRQMSGMTRCDWTHPAEATMISKYFGRQGREWATAYTCLGSWMCKTWRLYEVFYWSVRMPEYWPCSDLNTWRTWRCHHKRCGWRDEICRPWFAASWISLFPDSDQILLFCRWELKKPYIKIFYTKTFRIERVNQDIVHFTTYWIKKTKWHIQFRDLIHTFICLERRIIMKKEKLDVISWRRKKNGQL